MRSFIRGKAREIVGDPQKSKELRAAISRLRESANGDNCTEVKIGGKMYKVRLINQYTKK